MSARLPAAVLAEYDARILATLRCQGPLRLRHICHGVGFEIGSTEARIVSRRLQALCRDRRVSGPRYDGSETALCWRIREEAP